MTVARQRWAIFSRSVVSAMDNPDAHLLRGVGRELTRLGHEAIFYEERANAPVQALLRRHGSQALRDFRSNFPEISYRTMDVRTGWLLEDWLNRILATADAALVQYGAPSELVATVGRLTRPHLQTYLIDTGLDPVAALSASEVAVPGNYTGVFVGSEDAAARFAGQVDARRLHNVGPLVPASEIDEDDHYRTVSNQLTEQLVAAVVHERTSGRTTIGSNGHRPD